MYFLYKSFVPFNAGLLALLSAILATSDKQILIYGEEISHITILCILLMFMISTAELLFGPKAQQQTIKNIFFLHVSTLHNINSNVVNKNPRPS